jgi:hypothetical protein
VDSVRIGIKWRLIVPARGGPARWSEVDDIVENAARARIAVLPSVYGSPRWVARREATLPVESRSRRRAWAGFVRTVVRRYGPGGRFWSARPELPSRPIRTWQIWNEPNFFYFTENPDPGRYASLVTISRRAIRAVDPGGKLILGGMFALPGERPPRAYPAHRFLALMYERRRDIGRYIDGIAIHPYTRDFRHLKPILDQVRTTMRRAGDSGVGLWITEMGWGSQGGADAAQLESGPAGQARQLRGAFRILLRNRARWRLRQVNWFAVTDTNNPDACDFCDSAGLFTTDFRPKPAWRAFTSFTTR